MERQTLDLECKDHQNCIGERSSRERMGALAEVNKILEVLLLWWKRPD